MRGRNQVLISSKLQEMEMAQWIKSMEFDSNAKKIVVTLKSVDGVKEVGEEVRKVRSRVILAIGRRRLPRLKELTL